MSFIYEAPNPYPITLLDKLSNMWSSSLGDSFSSSSGSLRDSVLPALGRGAKVLTQYKINHLASEYNVSIDEGWVMTHDGASLQTVEVVSKQPDAHRYVLKFNGNGGMYQDLIEEFAKDAQALNATVVGFNYRGVGKSELKPKQFKKLVTDGIAQVNRLLIEKNVSPEQVLLDGHSLGGSVAIMVAKHFHDKGIKVYVWNDRSFSTLSSAAAGIISNQLPSLSESSLSVSSYAVLKPLGWEVDAAKAYKAIPYTHKGYMVVDKESGMGVGDSVISHQASLHQSVKKAEQKSGHQTGYTFFHPFEAGHNQPRASLKQSDNRDKSAQTVFEEFVKTHIL